MKVKEFHGQEKSGSPNLSTIHFFHLVKQTVKKLCEVGFVGYFLKFKFFKILVIGPEKIPIIAHF